MLINLNSILCTKIERNLLLHEASENGACNSKKVKVACRR